MQIRRQLRLQALGIKSSITSGINPKCPIWDECSTPYLRVHLVWSTLTSTSCSWNIDALIHSQKGIILFRKHISFINGSWLIIPWQCYQINGAEAPVGTKWNMFDLIDIRHLKAKLYSYAKFTWGSNPVAKWKTFEAVIPKFFRVYCCVCLFMCVSLTHWLGLVQSVCHLSCC